MSVRVEPGFFDYNAAFDSAGNYRNVGMTYFVFEAEDEETAKAAALAEIPLSLYGLARGIISIDERINEYDWKMQVEYKGPSFEPGVASELYPAISFDTTGGTVHINQSRETVSKYPSTAPDLEGAINYDGERVNGVDIIEPRLSFTYSKTVEKLTTKYMKTLADYTGAINQKAFRGFDAGEVLFQGASGGGRLNTPMEISFKFAVSPNMANYYVGKILVEKKYGWDYLWVRFEDEVDDGTKKLLKKPTAVYVERVSKIANFAGLGIGH